MLRNSNSLALKHRYKLTLSVKGDADPPDLRSETFQDMFQQKNAGDAVSILRRIDANVIAFRFDIVDDRTAIESKDSSTTEKTKCTILGSKSKRRIRLQSDSLDALYLGADELVHRLRRVVT